MSLQHQKFKFIVQSSTKYVSFFIVHIVTLGLPPPLKFAAFQLHMPLSLAESMMRKCRSMQKGQGFQSFPMVSSSKTWRNNVDVAPTRGGS
jgi:hypothetical protein